MRQPREHDLKTWPEPFEALKAGRKTFEFRRNDRGFAEGDTLILREWDPDDDRRYELRYTGRELRYRVSYVLKGGFGLPEGFVIMSIKKVRP